ncbi:hypothetical protein [Pseudodesulfovibrio pelocollis]|uniref:hypothetical protein n=1 Tax=Pseudodesulfovibrio pelocollis TaxID=3051432 RepID=UPI00255B0C1C|nr:hypothetical protein [Pseudodesulfovibrio sp. SB368]
MKFKAGDTVTWTSKSGGFSKTKSGKVIAVVPAKTPFEKVIDQHKITQENFNLSPAKMPGAPRDHESYVVFVEPESKRAKGRIYWPNVSGLTSQT